MWHWNSKPRRVCNPIPLPRWRGFNEKRSGSLRFGFPGPRVEILETTSFLSIDELEFGTAFINGPLQPRSMRDPIKPKAESQQLALADFCQAIFTRNEFIYVD